MCVYMYNMDVYVCIYSQYPHGLGVYPSGLVLHNLYPVRHMILHIHTPNRQLVTPTPV